MTTGRINQVAIPQGTRLGTLLRLPPFKGCPHSTHNLHWESTRPEGHTSPCSRPRETRSIFATSFHCCALVSFRHTSATVKCTECQQVTSRKNGSSESQPLFLAKGHQVQHPSVLSSPTGRRLGYKFAHFVLPTEQVWSTLLLFPLYATVSYPGTLPSRAYSSGPNSAQSLLRSFPKPALTLVPEIVYSPKLAATLRNFLDQKFKIFQTAPKRSQ